MTTHQRVSECGGVISSSWVAMGFPLPAGFPSQSLPNDTLHGSRSRYSRLKLCSHNGNQYKCTQ